MRARLILLGMASQYSASTSATVAAAATRTFGSLSASSARSASNCFWSSASLSLSFSAALGLAKVCKGNASPRSRVACSRTVALATVSERQRMGSQSLASMVSCSAPCAIPLDRCFAVCRGCSSARSALCVEAIPDSTDACMSSCTQPSMALRYALVPVAPPAPSVGSALSFQALR